MGALLAVFFAPISDALDAPRSLVVIGGVAVVVWGGLVARMSVATAWRPITIWIVAANLVAASSLAGIGLQAEVDPAVRVLLIGVGAQVFAFAALQAHALWSPFVR
jgi:hypothetical protein